MKVFISIDMEGISGLASWKEDPRRITDMMVRDLLSVIKGAREGGAGFFRVADSHSYGMNVPPEAELGVPVGLITGDKALHDFSRPNFPDPVRFVVTKEGVTRYAALLYSLERVREELRKGAREAVERSKEMGFFRLEPPYEVEIEFLDTLRADLAASLPFLNRVSGRRAVFRANNADEVLRHIVSMATLLLSAKVFG